MDKEYYLSLSQARIERAEQRRTASDYDDFYITSKQEAKEQVEVAKRFVEKVKLYLS